MCVSVQPRLKVGKIAAKAIAQREQQQQQQQGHKSKKQRSCQQQRQQQNASQDSEEEDQEDEAAGVEDQNRQDALGQLQQRLHRLQQQAQQQQRSNQQQRQRHQSLPQESEAQDQEVEEPDQGDQDALGQLLQQLQELHQELQLQQQRQQQNMGAEDASDTRNYSQIRGRLVAAVMKYAAQLLPRGDIILLVLLPLRKDGHLRTFHQGLTQDQLSATLDVLQNHETGSLGWMEARVQALLDMLGAGEVPGLRASRRLDHPTEHGGVRAQSVCWGCDIIPWSQTCDVETALSNVPNAAYIQVIRTKGSKQAAAQDCYLLLHTVAEFVCSSRIQLLLAVAHAG
jgi:Ca-activated chloride channel family protein